MEVITAYNFVVDSNVESPSTNGPSAAHLGVKIHNDGTVPLTDVYVKIGDLTDPLTSAGTPGTFPSRTVTVGGANGYSGTFALQMPGGSADALRYIPVIQPGEYVAQYFFVTYPLKDGSGNAVTGSAPDPSDDLWLNYDLWAYANEGVSTHRVDQTTKVTMRNEISAMANKIWPNTSGKVPDYYLDAIEASLGWRPDSQAPRTGSGVRLEGIWYDLGNVGAGFDNNGDGIPDRNAWMQPVGDPTPSLYDPLCVRLTKCYGLLVIKLNDGTEQLIPFEDQLYFENIPENNNGAVGLVYYEFMPLVPNCTTTLSPYQEVASGNDNEKFNGDYGTPGGWFTSEEPEITFDKNGAPVVGAGTTATYTMTASNSGTEGIGFPELSLPLIFEDAIPSSLEYVAGSATSSNTPPAGRTFEVSWSTDNGATWTTTEPVPASSVTTIRWKLDGSLDGGSTATVQFQAAIPITYPTATIDNTGCLKLGPTGVLACDPQTSFVSGINSIGDLVWQDDDRDSVKDAGESGIANVTVSLYYDADGDGVVDAGEPLFGTDVTDASGIYGFANLPDGKFIVVVDQDDADLPTGYTLPNSVTVAQSADLDSARVNSSPVVHLTADWPFIGALEVTKTISPTTYGEGDLLTYSIKLENFSTAIPPPPPPVQTAYASTVTAGRTPQNAANAQGAPDNVYANANWGSGNDYLNATGYTYADPSGAITKVEIVFEQHLTSALNTSQSDTVRVVADGTTMVTLNYTNLNSYVGSGNEGLYVVDVTSRYGSWTWAQAQALIARLEYDRVGPNDGSSMNVDMVGIRVTTTAPPPPTGSYGPTTIDPLPLTDTYDSTKLEYVSASLLPTSVSPGTITWANAGPLNAGGVKTITVTFRALTPPDIDADNEPDPTTTINTATSTGSRFVSGRNTNDDTSNVTVTINPRGEIGDLVWWDIDADGVRDGGEPGLANVRVTLSNGTETRTDASGYYIFRSLVDGTYTVTIDTTTLPFSSFSQTHDPDATVNNASTVTINNNDGNSANDGYLDRDFGYDSTLNVITGTIFQDNNGDGDQDSGENYLSGLTVTLLRDADTNGSYETTFATTTTNSSGFYSFNSLPNGLFRVVVTQPGSTTQTLDPDLPPGNTSGDNATNENASGGNLYPNNDFAYRPTGALTLGDTLYLDWNGDGDQDSGEDGIANVDVRLYEDVNGDGVIDSADDALIATATSNASGVYSFTGLVADDYIVVVVVSDPQFPADVLQTQDYDGTLDNLAKVPLSASLSTVDFGYEPQGTGSIGDVVFIDADGDGAKDAGESGIANITVTLYEDTNNNGVIDIGTDAVVATDVSDSSGIYGFSGLPAGNYLVDVDHTDADLPDDSYGFVYRRTTSDPHDVTLAASQSYLTADFGFAASATIGDMVFFDANNNGTQDYSEEGIPDVTVELWADDDEDGQPDVGGLLASVTTADGTGADPAGFYRFTNLAAGHYFVKVVTSTLPQVSGNPIDQTADPDRDGIPVGSPPATPPGDNGDSDVIVSLGSNYGGADFGYQPAGVLGDFVWLDLDGDGVQDPGEPGIANVAIEITDGVTTYNATTDFDGYWTVANIADGTWTITVLASNFNAGGPLENMSNTFDADGGTNSSVSAVIDGGIVGPTGNPWCSGPDCSLDIDFGYEINGSYTIAGTVVIHDTGVVGTADDPDIFAEDGTDMDLGPNDETELAGVPVYLYRGDGSGGWDFIGSTTTDANGNYSFTGLPDDDYRVIIPTTATPLNNANLTTTTANAGAINSEVTDVTDTGTSVRQTLTLAGGDVSNVDFAFLSTVDYDFGDLPSSFGLTTLAQDGARHTIPGGGSTLHLGSAPDTDLDGAPTALADGDDNIGSDDEGGVAPLNITSWTNGTVGSGNGGDVTITTTVPAGGGWLVGYMDFNQDNDFLDAGELILSQAIATSGTANYAFDIPAGSIDGTEQSFFARFRIFADEPPLPVFAYEGEAADGEVEDYLFTKPVGASIGNIVWVDTDGDGVFDNDENGLGGLTINLSGDATATMTTSDGTQDVDNDGITDPVGYYRFTGLAAGSYTVSFTLPAGYTPSYDEDGGTSSPNTSTPVTLASGEQHLTADFGLEPLTASINGQVRDDTDSDGELADPDSGIPYVIVQLWTDPNGDGDPSDGVQVGETLTNANGQYQFQSFPTGDYVVVEIDPSGATSTADVSSPNDNHIPVALVGGTDSNGNDFLDHMGPTHGISGFVYDDGTPDDNTFGAGDTPLPWVLVSLYRDINNNGVYDVGEPLLAQQLTNGSGSYSFSGLADAQYIVIETDPSGATSEADTQGSLTDNTILVVLAGADNTGNNFLDDGVPLLNITGSVFDDTGDDDTLDGNGESPIPGVVVSLYSDLNGNGQQDGGDILISSAATDLNGDYWFTGLPPGNYVVVETQPLGYTTSDDDAAGSGTDNTIAVALTTSSSAENDFLDDGGSLYQIITNVYNDTADDNTLNGTGETGITGVTVALYVDVNNNGLHDGGDLLVSTAITDGQGQICFHSVPPGSYVLVETDPSGATSDDDTDGSNTDNMIGLDVINTDLVDNDFLDDALVAAISGAVFNDTGDDDTLDGSGETPIPGVIVSLYSDPNGDGDPSDGFVIATTATNSSGAYTFSNVVAGNYVIVETQPSGFTTSDDDSSGSPTDNHVPVTLAAGVPSTGNDFLDDGGTLYNASGHAYHDYPSDGELNGSNEAPMQGVTITLYADINGDGLLDGYDVLIGSTTTNSSGLYTFAGLAPGSYVVVETDPSGSISLDDVTGDPSDNTVAVTITTADSTGNDFLDYNPDQPGSISGKVWADTDNDDLGNTGIAGVVLTLLDSTGAIIDGDSGTPDVQPITATTNGSGEYTFANVPPGSYQVGEAQPVGYASVNDADGGDYDVVGDQTLIVLDAGESETGKDFIEEQYGAIAGTVWADTDNDDAGEAGIAGVLVELWTDPNADGNPADGAQVGAPATTDADGEFSFANVLPGSYVLVQSQPAGYLDVTDGDTTTPGDDAANTSTTDSQIPVSIAAGETDDGNDFIEEQPGTISGTVTGLSPMTGVSIALFSDPDGNGDPSDGGQIGSSVLTGAGGVYTFTNVPPGDYVVIESQPAGWVSVSDADTTNAGDDTADAGTDNRIPVSITAGETDDGNNFVEGCPTIVLNPATLPNGTVGTAYSQTVSATGGTAPYSFSVTAGSLPAGLALSGGGTLSGTPTSPDNETFTITATDANGCSGAHEFTIVTTCPTITVNPSSLPGATVGTSYSQTISATGGTEPYAFAVTSGTLPTGLTLAGGGLLSGTPTVAGTFNFTITATDDNGCTGQRALSIEATCPTITVSPSSLPGATVGTSYSQTISASGGTEPYAFTVTSGTLPTGLTLTGSGLLSGTPTAAGTFNFTVTATDDNNCTGQRALSIVATCPTITVDPSSLPGATVGTAYSQTISASGGIAPYTFAVTSGTLPAGLTLTGGGLLSGTPTAAGTFNFTITATDDNDCTGQRALSIVATCPTITVSPTSLPGATVGTAYSQTISATGGTEPYTFAVTSGTLPEGLSLTGGGLLSGTPTETGTFNFTITATDDNDCTGQRALSITSTCPTIILSSTPDPLPNGSTGTPYNATISASGGTGPYGFALKAGSSLPAGLSLSSAGAITGTPTDPGGTSFIIVATDDNGCDGEATFTISVSCPTITVSPDSLSNGVVGTAYGPVIFSQTGGTGTITWALSGTLPAGMSFTTATATLGGTPTETGTFSVTVSAEDQNGCIGSVNLTFSTSCPSIDVTPDALPGGTVGTAYSQTLSATGGASPHAFAVTSGALPTGLTLTGGGLLSGTPTAAGTFNFIITATDDNDCTGTQDLSITMSCPAITVNPATLPDGTVGTAYSQTLTATGGTEPYTFTHTGTLPTGLTLTSGGLLSGTPTAAGTFNFTITATDDNDCTGQRAFEITTTCPAITVTPASLPAATVGTNYSQALGATGGTLPYSFAVTAGALPSGLSLVNGVISGTPDTTGTANFTITATDAHGCSGSLPLSITTSCPAIDVSPDSLPGGTAGVAYSQTITATGGTEPYTFTHTGTLPTGLSLAGGGLLSGTPTAAGTFNFTVTATDDNGCTGTQALSVTISCPDITMAPATLPAATVGSAYSATFSASGGTEPYTFALTGTLPAGLTFAVDAISGTPTSATGATFTITATDANGCEGQREYTLTPVCPTITLSSTPSPLDSGTVGVPYTGSIGAAGGTGPYSFVVKAGSSLPPGLELSSVGAITGTPTANGSTNTIIVATDTHGCSAEATFTINIGCNTLVINPSSLGNGTVGAAYGPVDFNATGGTGVLVWQLTGTLPDGMTFDTGTGELGGTPTEEGTFNITILVTDENTCAGSVNLAFSTSCPSIDVTPDTLPGGTVGTGYSQSLSATGGTAPYAFAVTSGTLPAGLTLDGNTISGTPTAAGTSNFTITATDANECEGTQTLAITVTCPAITITPGTLPDGVLGTAYSQALTASGGSGPYTFSVSAGGLPAGLLLAGNTISGTPTTAGTFNFTITATDTHNCSGSLPLSITTACPAIDVSPDSLPGGTAGVAYSQTITATGGTEPYTFTHTGTLPTGLTLTGGGLLSGTPTAAGTFNFTITATDDNDCTGTQSLSITISCPEILVTSAPDPLEPGTIGVPYTGAITASGGATPYAYTLETGSSLPAGLALGSTGAITGTPTANGSSTFTVVVTDANGCDGSAEFTISIGCPTITVSPSVLPDAAVGVAYNQTVSATGGAAPHSFAITSGALPTGLSLAGNAISGTPTAAGTFNFTITATDDDGCQGSRALSIEVLTAAISGSVFADGNNDNVGDIPFVGAQVGLYTDPNGDGDPSDGTQVGGYVLTDDDGLYTFTNVPPGDYVVVLPPLVGYLPALDGDTTDGGDDAANTGTTDRRIPVTLAAGESDTGNDFIEELSGAISNLVWVDADNDGLKDGSESGLDGVQIELLNGSGASIDSDPLTGGTQPTVTTTAGGGLYSFAGLAPGSFQLRIASPPASHPISSTTTDTSDNGQDDDDNGTQSVAGGAITSPVIALGAGEDDVTLDFGLVAAGTIGNLVWHDADNDGLKGGSETGIDGVVLELLDSLENPVDDPNLPGVQPYTTATSGGGAYTFTNLVPGNYIVRVPTPPPGFPMSSAPTSTNDDGVDDDDNGWQVSPSALTITPVIEIAHGESDSTMDFGFTSLMGVFQIAGQVRDDYDVDGEFSDLDQPVPNVTVELYADTNGNGTFDPGTDALLDTETTDAFGNYLFTGVPNGTYFVQEVDPNPSESTADTDGPNDNLIKVVIFEGDSIGNDFLDAVDPAGYIYHSVTGQIIAGGTMSVTGPGTITMILDGSTGQYSFISDTGGTFTLTYTPPAGYVIDPLRPVAGPSFDPTGLTPDPYPLGSDEDSGNPGYLDDHTSGGNPYYLEFVLAPGDPFVINNNIPLVEAKPSTFTAWQYSNPLGGQNGATDDPDGDGFTNLEEFAFCFTPQSGVNGACPLEIGLNGDGTLDAIVRRLTNYSGLTYQLEYIADLAASGANGAGWTVLGSIIPSNLDNGDGTTTATYANLAQVPALATGRGYVRVKVTETASGTVARTYAAGWGTRALPAGCQSCAVPFLRCALFTGKVDAVISSVLNITSSAGSGDFTAAFSPTKQYYIEVTAGDNAGHRFEVNEGSSTATNLVLDGASTRNTQTSIPASLVNDSIVLREHLTIGEAYPPSAFTATNNPATADRMIFFNRSAGSFEVYWLFLAAGNPRWVLNGDAGLLSQNDRVLDPCEGHFIHPRNNATSVTFTGEIRENAFACPLQTGTNFFAGGWPLDQSPNQRGMTVANGFTGTNNPATSDRILLWNGDTTPGAESYQSHFLLNAGARQQWTPQSNASLLNENDLPLFDDQRSALLRATGSVNWVMPLGWTP